MQNPERAKVINHLLFVNDDFEKKEIETTSIAHINATLKMLEHKVAAFDEAETYEVEEKLIICNKTNKIKGYCLVVSINNTKTNS